VGVPTPHDRPSPPDHSRSLGSTALALIGVDFPHQPRRPRPSSWALATVLSVVGSLAADALLVAIGTSLFPSTRGYVHFRLTDYGKLTVVGVLFASAAWPLVTRVSSSARPLFFRLAVLVTLVLLLPDIWILVQGQPVRAVAVLMAMHLAIALLTYNALVHLAPPRPPSVDAPPP
jgi:hypothetical protein